MLRYKISLASKIISFYKKAIKQQEFYDMYALEVILSFADVINISQNERKQLQLIFKNLVTSAAKEYSRNLKASLIREASILDQFHLTEQQKQKLLDNNISLPEEGNLFLTDLSSLSPKQFEIIFSLDAWEGPYGGKAWMIIASTYGKLLDAMNADDPVKMFSVIDQIHQLEHNTNSIFASFGMEGVEQLLWLHSALTTKAIASSLIIIKDKVSLYLKKYIEKIPGVANATITNEQYEHERGEVEYNRFLSKLERNAQSADFTSHESAKEAFNYVLNTFGKERVFKFVTMYLNTYQARYVYTMFAMIKKNNLKKEYFTYLATSPEVSDKRAKYIIENF